VAVVYHLAQMFLVLAGLQWYFCTRNPIFMPRPEGRVIFHAWGAVATIGMVILFILGFFILPWWMPITAWLLGQVAFLLVPQKWKESSGPGVGFLSTLAGIGSTVALFLV